LALAGGSSAVVAASYAGSGGSGIDYFRDPITWK
jgi:hypothetical protein